MIIPVWEVTVIGGQMAGTYTVKGGNEEYARDAVFESLGLSVVRGNYGGMSVKRLEDQQTANISGEGSNS